MTRIKKISLWKWIIELVPGIFVLMTVYGIAQTAALMIESLRLKAVVSIASGAAILGLFLLWARLFEKEWRTDTLACPNEILKGMAVGALFFCAITGILAALGAYRAGYASPHWGMIMMHFCFYFLVACSEEAIFRGILFRLIDERFGFWWAIGISSLAFGFAHAFQPGATIWSSVAIAVEAGLLLGAAFKYAGTLWLPIGIHWAWNFTQGNIFGLEVSGNGEEESIMNAVLKGPDIITGGDFGPEASIFAAVLGTALSIRFIHLIRTSHKKPAE